MAEAQKDTIYVDVDDEITTIIEKLRDAKHKIVALVLPKRASALQSIVNMKLLKRTAKEENKQLVLITSEASLLPLAGAVGVHVAKTLQSKPVVPEPPDMSKSDDEEPDIDQSKSVGELSVDDEAPAKVADPEDTINIDDIDDEPTPTKKAKKSKVKVPNFDSFRKKLFFGAIGTALLIIFLIFATKVWPSAAITIKTNTATIDVNFDFTASTSAQSVNIATNTVPAVQKDSQQTNSHKAAATGQKNKGERATGTVSLQNCSNTAGSVTVASGTTVKTGDLTYITQSSVTLPQSIFAGGSHACLTGSKDVSVKAQNPGSDYNISSGKAFSVSGYSGVNGSNANSFSGGTDKTVTVVSQSDIDGAKKKATDDNGDAKKDLIKEFQDDDLLPLEASILPGKQTVSTSAKVGDEATEVTVTVETTYTMLGVKQDDLKQLVDDDTKDSLKANKQKISDYGLDKATFAVKSKKSPTEQTMTIQATASTGAQIDTAALKLQIAGKKKGDVEQIIQELPGVESVDVSFSPFWVNKVPKNPGKVTITVETNQIANDSNSSN